MTETLTANCKVSEEANSKMAPTGPEGEVDLTIEQKKDDSVETQAQGQRDVRNKDSTASADADDKSATATEMGQANLSHQTRRWVKMTTPFLH